MERLAEQLAVNGHYVEMAIFMALGLLRVEAALGKQHIGVGFECGFGVPQRRMAL